MSRKPLRFTAEELELLREIAVSPPTGLPSEKQRDLRILLGLIENKQGKVLAREERVSGTWVSRLRDQAAKGLKATIDRILAAQERMDAEKPKAVRAHAGRPGYETYAAWAAAMRPEDEPICEMVSLYITSLAQIAVIGFREGREDEYKRDRARAEKANRLAEFLERRRLRTTSFASEVSRAAATPVDWTRVSMLDTVMAEVFEQLAGGVTDAAIETELPIPSLPSRFGERFRFVAFSEGRDEVRHGLLQKIVDDSQIEYVRADSTLGFSRHLEAFFHGRRLKASCAGLLPTAWRLRDDVRTWFLDGRSQPLAWNIDEVAIHDSVQYHSLTEIYFGAKGVLPSMQSHLWGKIGHREEIRLRALPIATRVEAADATSPGIHLRVEPLPNIAYNVRLPSQEDVNALTKSLRQRLRQNKGSKHFIYSTRQRGPAGIRPSIQLSSDFIAAKSETSGIGVVLLPRHFVTAAPELPLDGLSAFAEADRGKADNPNKITIDGKNYIFRASVVVDEIRRKLADGSYRRKLDELEEWQSTLTDLGATALEAGAADTLAISLKIRAEAVLGRDLWDVKTEKGWTENPLGMLFGFAEEFPIQPDGSIRPIPGTATTSEQDIENLVTNVDADFLLLSFDASIRTTLDTMVESWNTAIGDLITNDYWPVGLLNSSLVRKLIPGVSDAVFNDQQTEVETLCDEARRTFQADPKYVLRAAMENMQRLALKGLPPSALVVETKARILSRWRALLRRVLKGRLMPESVPGANAEDEVDIAESLNRADEAEVIAELVKNIRTSTSEPQVEQFVQWAHEIEEPSWLAAIEKLAAMEPEVRWFEIVPTALRSCKNPKVAGSEKAILDEVARLLRG